LVDNILPSLAIVHWLQNTALFDLNILVERP
jgi:hypothetical protein